MKIASSYSSEFRCRATVLVTGALLGATTLAYPRTALDTPTFAYIARTMLEGGAPYRDAFDVKGPGVHVVNLLSLVLFGQSSMGLRIIEVLWQTITALIIFQIARRLLPSLVAARFAGVAYLVFYFSQNFWVLAQPDGLLMLPWALSILCLLRAREKDRLYDWGFSAGFLGITVLFKLPMGLFGIFILWVASRVSTFRVFTTGSRWLAVAIGFLVPLLFAGVYYYIIGGLADLLNSQFILAPQYTTWLRKDFGFTCYAEAFTRPALAPIYVLSTLIVAAQIWNRASWSFTERLLAVWIGTVFIILIAHGHFLEYAFLPLLAPLSIWSVKVIYNALVSSTTGKSWRRLVPFFVACSLIVPAFQFARHARYLWSAFHAEQPLDSWQPVGEYLRTHTTVEDTIFVWGNVPSIYIHANRRSSSRFIYTLFVTIPWRKLDFKRTLLDELTVRRPRYVVVITQPVGPYCPRFPDQFEVYQRFDEFRQLVNTSYDAVPYPDPRLLLFRRKE